MAAEIEPAEDAYARGVQDTIARLTSDEAVKTLREFFWTPITERDARAVLSNIADSLAAEPTTDLGEKRHG